MLVDSGNSLQRQEQEGAISQDEAGEDECDAKSGWIKN